MGRGGGRLTAVLTNVLYFLGPAFAPFQTHEEGRGGRPPLIMAALVYVRLCRGISPSPNPPGGGRMEKLGGKD